MNRKIILIPAAFTLLLLTIIFSSCGNGKETNSIHASGTIESVNVTISSKTSGTINKINFKEGDRVKKGDLLVEISHDLLDIQLRQSEAGVELANAQLKLLRSGARREDIKQSEDLVKQAGILHCLTYQMVIFEVKNFNGISPQYPVYVLTLDLYRVSPNSIRAE